MTLDCPRCHRALEFSGDRPRFCAYCGGSVADSSMLETVDTGSASGPGLASGQATMAYGPAVATAGAPRVRERVGNYRLIRQLGQGGMGTVHEAEDLDAGRRVALKLVSPGIVATPEAIERFRQEGRLASAIAHPRCVFVLAADEDEGHPYIAMELMTGENLQDLVARGGPLAVVDAVAKILDVAEGLAEAHRLGVIHRDVKPSNCFLEADGRVKVGDFGLSKSLGVDAGLTRTGAFLGTPLYASPEQIKAEDLDARTDVYSVAATLYFLLTGQPPHEGRDAASTLAKIVSETPPTVRALRAEVPRELDFIVMKGLERARERRWRDLHDLREALAPFAIGRTSIGGLGLRVGAYVFDVEGNKFFAIFLANMIAVLSTGKPFKVANNMYMSTIIDMTFFLVNFVFVETWIGCSPGKKLLRLRVFNASHAGRPPVGRGLLRAGIFFGIVILPSAVCRYTVIAWPSYYWLAPATKVLSLLVIASTMRASNGYRGIHELLSGTRVVRLANAARRRDRMRLGAQAATELSHPEGLPVRLGTFEVRGAIRWEGGGGRLLGLDSSLGREVWIDVGPPGGAPLPAARRDLSRASRPRWVGGGALGDRRWEAFLRPIGSPLGRDPRLAQAPWREVRPGFEQLAEELAASAVEGTLPRRLDPANILVDPGVGLILDDGPEGVGPADEPMAAASERALRFLGEAGALAIEGKPRAESDRGRPIRGPIPIHARAIIDRLLGVGPAYPTFGAALADLKATRDAPTELGQSTRVIRALNASIGLAIRFVPPTVLGLLLQWVIWRRFGGSSIHAPGGRSNFNFTMDNTVFFSSIALCWLPWAAATRGGLLPRLLGLSLVDRDGLPPSRLRCVGRELLIWGPFCTLLAFSDLPVLSRPGLRWLEMASVLLGLVWVLADAAHEFWRSGQHWHDRASGTRVVPR